MVEDDDVSMDEEASGPLVEDDWHEDPYGRIPLRGKPGKFSLGV